MPEEITGCLLGLLFVALTILVPLVIHALITH